MRKFAVILTTMFIGMQSIAVAQTSGFDKLDKWVGTWKSGQQTYFGYPVNQQSEMHDFYEWYISTGLESINLNNAGDPMSGEPWRMSSQMSLTCPLTSMILLVISTKFSIALSAPVEQLWQAVRQ